MAESRNLYTLREDESGEIRIADEVVALVAGLAATEIEGVSLLVGTLSNELMAKLRMQNLSRGIRVEVSEDQVRVDMALHIGFGYAIPDICAKVQERVKSSVENMTGLKVSKVNIRIVSVDMSKNKH